MSLCAIVRIGGRLARRRRGNDDAVCVDSALLSYRTRRERRKRLNAARRNALVDRRMAVPFVMPVLAYRRRVRVCAAAMIILGVLEQLRMGMAVRDRRGRSRQADHRAGHQRQRNAHRTVEHVF